MLFIGFCTLAQTQQDSIQKLDEVVLSDVKLKHYASGVKITVLNDSILKKNATSLTSLLAFNSNIYFKENGYGMVSSPSFRGTNASQTAVIWNGININSQLNGQTDFNTVGSSNYNSISIRSGGGSVQYGSGAIGGSIHLTNKLAFNDHFDNAVNLSYGSFDTKQLSFSSSFGNSKWSGNLGIATVDSENNYKYLGTDQVNENGAFNNLDISANIGYLISEKDVLKLYHQNFTGERAFSGTLVAPSRSKYENNNFRSLLEWSRISGKINSKLKFAHLQEHFKYFENKNKDNYSFGKVNTWILKHDFNYRFSEALQLKSIVDYNYIEGSGSSFGNPNRKAFSTTVLLSHKPIEALSYGLNIRKDFTSGFKSPFVFSLDTKLELNNNYILKINGSKNYRVPTFNDLYWQPGGNLDLVPESSYQLDFGQELTFNFLDFKLNAFYIITEDLIQWRPNASGNWQPINVAEVENYGLEAELRLHKKFNAHNVALTTHYSYTVSEDLETHKQLIYVPFHKANTSIAYSYKSFSMYYQHLFNGEVFITNDNLTGPFHSLKSYDISNLGFNYVVLNNKNHQLDMGIKINNIFNKGYQNVASRPMPDRNVNIKLNYKF